MRTPSTMPLPLPSLIFWKIRDHLLSSKILPFHTCVLISLLEAVCPLVPKTSIHCLNILPAQIMSTLPLLSPQPPSHTTTSTAFPSSTTYYLHKDASLTLWAFFTLFFPFFIVFSFFLSLISSFFSSCFFLCLCCSCVHFLCARQRKTMLQKARAFTAKAQKLPPPYSRDIPYTTIYIRIHTIYLFLKYPLMN